MRTDELLETNDAEIPGFPWRLGGIVLQLKHSTGPKFGVVPVLNSCLGWVNDFLFSDLAYGLRGRVMIV